jgi:hypothetical protein
LEQILYFKKAISRLKFAGEKKKKKGVIYDDGAPQYEEENCWSQINQSTSQ